MNLDTLEVKSFITSLSGERTHTVRGGESGMAECMAGETAADEPGCHPTGGGMQGHTILFCAKSGVEACDYSNPCIIINIPPIIP